MSSSHQRIVGSIALIAGLSAVVAGGTVAPRDAIVALGWLVVFPLVISLIGIVFMAIGLVRTLRDSAASALEFRIPLLGAVVGLGLGLAFGVAGILSQIPDTIAGLNGSFVPGPAPAMSVFVIGGIGALAGFVVGVGAAIVSWRRSYRRATGPTPGH